MKALQIKDVEEATITRAILEGSLIFLSELVESDVVIVGAGPAGLTAARYLAGAGLKTVIFERRLSFGGRNRRRRYAAADTCGSISSRQDTEGGQLQSRRVRRGRLHS